MKEATILELKSKMDSGERTAHSLIEDFLERIEAIDKSGPSINSIIELNPDAPSIAYR